MIYMKKTISTFTILVLLSLSSTLFAQAYNFTKAKESFSYIKMDGTTGYKEVGIYTSSFKVVFEKGTDGRTQIATFYKGSDELYWATQLEERGNYEIKGKIYKSLIYANATSEEIFNMYFSTDYETLITEYKDRIIEYTQKSEFVNSSRGQEESSDFKKSVSTKVETENKSSRMKGSNTIGRLIRDPYSRNFTGIQSVYSYSPILNTPSMGEGEKVVGLAKNNLVKIVEKYSNKFYKVESGNQTGYIWSGWFVD